MNEAGKMGTLLSQTFKDVLLDKSLQKQLVRLCITAARKGDIAKVKAFQPLIYTLGAMGEDVAYSDYIRIMAVDENLQEADLTRNVEEFYGSLENQIEAIIRHLLDPYRPPFQLTHDIGLLFKIIAVLQQRIAEARDSKNDEQLVHNMNLLLKVGQALEITKKILDRNALHDVSEKAEEQLIVISDGVSRYANQVHNRNITYSNPV